MNAWDGETSAGSLLENLLLFGRMLHSLGLDVDTGRMIDLVGALQAIQIGNKEDFYHTLRCLLVHHREDFPVFDLAFDLYWRKPDGGRLRGEARTSGTVRRSRKPAVIPPPLRLPDQEPHPKSAPDPSSPDRPPVVQATLTYSSREVLRRKDFAELSPEELEAIKRLLSELVWQLGMRRTRRFQPGGGPTADLRRTVRRNLQYGGEVLAWSRKEPKYKPRPLVIIADISGSMERYTRLLLHFAYSLSKGFEHGAETFVFSTRLTRITHELQKRDVDAALKEVAHAVPDWSGGTRIGEALKSFNFGWGRRVLGRGAVVLLISDGWDRGDAGLLRSEIARLQRTSHRLIWLNPLLGSESYEPLTRGMQTALPYIDDFLPVHNLASLEDLARHLQRVESSRPLRRQVVHQGPAAAGRLPGGARD